MGVREALWLIGLALVCYAVWQFFRALRAPRSSAAVAVLPAATGGGEPETPRGGAGHAALRGGPARPSGQGRLEAGAQTAEQNEGDREAENEDGFDAYAPLPAAQTGPTQGRAQESPPVQSDVAQPDVFQLQLDNSRLRQALQAQRDLVALQQDEIDRLVQDITALQDELERLRDQPTSSPEYSEAMVLAAQGLNAEMIAARCGITVAEAELVLSLARRGEGTA